MKIFNLIFVGRYFRFHFIINYYKCISNLVFRAMDNHVWSLWINKLFKLTRCLTHILILILVGLHLLIIVYHKIFVWILKYTGVLYFFHFLVLSVGTSYVCSRNLRGVDYFRVILSLDLLGYVIDYRFVSIFICNQLYGIFR